MNAQGQEIAMIHSQEKGISFAPASRRVSVFGKRQRKVMCHSPFSRGEREFVRSHFSRGEIKLNFLSNLRSEFGWQPQKDI